MLGCTRVSDVFIGVCFAHKTPIGISGVIVTNSPNVSEENLKVARLGDVGVASCGHSGVIVTSSGVTFVNNIGHARLTDIVSGPFIANISTSASITFTS